METYTSWYIADKDIQEVKLRIEVEAITEGSAEHCFHILEVAEMLNKEATDDVLYKVVTGWEIGLVPDGNTYKIKYKQLKESVISYKDDNQGWIAY